MSKIDSITKDFIRNRSDEKAVKNGCYMNVDMGGYVVWWIERHLRLYEGEHAGEPVRLMGCLDCQQDMPIPDEYDSELAHDRARQFCQCVRQGHNIDWQYEVTMRLFGWARFSERYDRPIRRFRKASIWVPKKNKKTPTEAAWGCYMFVGDGEKGQNLFSVAKDGVMAKRLGHKHAELMIRKSPVLDREIKINKTTGKFWHNRSESTWEILSGDNDKSTEGVNGSIMVDETHVVPRKLVGRINRAGISRSEPLHAEVSTVGDDPDSYGKGRFDHGLLVESGQIEEQDFLFVYYGAPQDLTPEELAKDPLKYCRMANPAWGHTIFEEEILSDYNASKNSILELAAFMMYRLNIWQKGSCPWLKFNDWNNCFKEYSDEDLFGEYCWLSADLSKTQDMSAVALVFPTDDEEVYKSLLWFWMTEAYAHAKKKDAAFLEWADQGYLTLTEGDVIDYGAISHKIRQLAEQFQIQEFIYDETYANQLFQNLSEGIYEGGQEILAPLGIPRTAFKQSLANYAAPCDDFEARVRQGQFKHNGHPVLSWMAGHVKAKRDAGGRMMPVKPDQNSFRKIDGIQASVMALAGAVNGEIIKASYYSGNELEMG